MEFPSEAFWKAETQTHTVFLIALIKNMSNNNNGSRIVSPLFVSVYITASAAVDKIADVVLALSLPFRPYHTSYSKKLLDTVGGCLLFRLLA
eukprot:m.56441 g.56441  ORF g.56441 m.56441 type:complete len:92 (-) comp11039_c0_seq1:2020-2295(-)